MTTTAWINLLLVLFQTPGTPKLRPVWTMKSAYRAEDFRSMNEVQRYGYLTGFIDGLGLGPMFAEKLDKTTFDRFLACVKDKSPNQISAIVAKHIEANPEEWHFSLSRVAWNALNGACATSRGRADGR